MYLFEQLNKMGTTVVIASHNEPLLARFHHPVLHIDAGELTFHPPRRRPVSAEA